MSEKAEDALFAARFAWREIGQYLPEAQDAGEAEAIQRLLNDLKAFAGKLEMDTNREVA